MRKSLMTLGFASALCASLVGCTVIPTSLPHQTTSDLGDRQVEFLLKGSTSPTVIFENGLDGTLGWWSKVLPEVASQATVLAYNRPGYGKSSPATTPRDGLHVVEELRAFLRFKHLHGPYVLVGHSLGGLYMQLFARMYPEEVSGLVLVDSTHPQQLEGAGATEHWPAWYKALFPLTTSPAAQAELSQLTLTGEQVLGLPVPPEIPMTILVAPQPIANNSAVALDANAKRMDFQRLYPNAKFIQVRSGHGIPQEHPEVVVAAIRDLLRLP